MIDLQELAADVQGDAFAFAYRNILRAMQPLLEEDENVRLLTLAESGWGSPGVLLVTSARCLYVVRRLFRYQEKSLPFDENLQLEVKPVRRNINMWFQYRDEEDRYRLLIGIHPPPAENVLAEIVALARTAGGKITPS